MSAYEETARRLNMSLYSIYYTGVSDWVASFDADKAATDWQKVRPALEQIQAVFGTDNFQLPSTEPQTECD